MRGGTRNIAILLLVLALFEIILIRSYSIFHRFVAASTMICAPLIGITVENWIENGKVVKVRNLIIVCLLILGLACVRGNLCGYKFFIL